MKYGIYPSIGIARVGNSPGEFYIGPDAVGAEGVELDENGDDTPVRSFKDVSFRMKRMAARFALYEFPEDGPSQPAKLPEGARVTWTVRLANKKDAVNRPITPGSSPMPVNLVGGREDRVIEDGGTVSGPSAAPVRLEGSYRKGQVAERSVYLGSIFTDAQTRLVVLGGYGRSESPTGASIGASFYNNPDWVRRPG